MLETPDVSIVSANAPWGLLNTAFLQAPVETEAALERAVAAAISYFTPRKQAWNFAMCEGWLAPGLRAQAPAIMERQGLTYIMSVMGMVAEKVAPPVRTLPPIEVRLATDAEALRHISDINAISYASPLELARASIVVPPVFQGDGRGYVGYVEGKAVSVVAVFRVEGVAYVGLMATLPEYRRRGYAEAVMRHGLADARRLWGTERTVLHATDAGRSIYLRMGYRDVTRFALYIPPLM